MTIEFADSVLLIESSDKSISAFGSGFVAFQDEFYDYIVTCAHVLKAVGGNEKVRVAGHSPKVLAMGLPEGPDDLAVLRIRTSTERNPIPISTSVKEGDIVTIPGFRRHSSIFNQTPITLELCRRGGLFSRGSSSQVQIWTLEWNGKERIVDGNSGAPVICNKTGGVFAVAIDKLDALQRGTAISISELVGIWPDIPAAFANSLNLEQTHSESLNLLCTPTREPYQTDEYFHTGDQYGAFSPVEFRRSDSILDDRSVHAPQFVRDWLLRKEQSELTVLSSYFEADVRETLLSILATGRSMPYEDSNSQIVPIQWVELSNALDLVVSPDSIDPQNILLTCILDDGHAFEQIESSTELIGNLPATCFLCDVSFVSMSKWNSDDEYTNQIIRLLRLLLRTFDNLTERRHTLLLGLPRFLMSNIELQRLLDIPGANKLQALELFKLPGRELTPDPELADTFSVSQSAQEDFTRNTMWVNTATSLLPKDDELAHAIAPMLGANSNILQRYILEFFHSNSESPLTTELSRNARLLCLIKLAQYLAEKRLLEPAFRLELFCRSEVELQETTSLSGVTSIEGGVVNKMSEIPKISPRLLLCGEAGSGKSVILHQIENHWSLPQCHTIGKHYHTWLPLRIQCDDIGKSLSLPVSFILPDQPDRPIRLCAHEMLTDMLCVKDFTLHLSSPVLLLLDDLTHSSDYAFTIKCLEEYIREFPNTGCISTHPHKDEVPSDSSFRFVFRDSPYVRISDLGIPQAMEVCGQTKANVTAMFSAFDQPISTLAGNAFLLHCISQSNLDLSCWNSRGDIVSRFVECKVGKHPTDAMCDVVDIYLPEIAFCLRAGAKIPNKEANMHIALNLGFLSSKLSLTFSSVQLEQYFLSKYVAQTWDKKGAGALFKIFGTSIRWNRKFVVGFLETLICLLNPKQQLGLIDFLLENDQETLAHRILLQLSPQNYYQNKRVPLIRRKLIKSIEHGVVDDAITAATVLGYYDPRIPSVADTVSNMIELPIADQMYEVSMGKYPVTVLEYGRFVNAGGYSEKGFWHPAGWDFLSRTGIKSPMFWSMAGFNQPNFPVVGISFFEALAYCRWLTSELSTNAVVSLPTVELWRLAANLLLPSKEQILVQPDERRKGAESRQDELLPLALDIEEIDLMLRNTLHTHHNQLRHASLTPIGCFSKNQIEIYDMFGNVWEWCDAWYPNLPEASSPSEVVGTEYSAVIVQGGPASDESRDFVSAIGAGFDPFTRLDTIGFRVCASIRAELSKEE